MQGRTELSPVIFTETKIATESVWYFCFRAVLSNYSPGTLQPIPSLSFLSILSSA